jgi:pyruvate dehydrogenase E2 component (dihydrolipoamide acetyltransferase)
VTVDLRGPSQVRRTSATRRRIAAHMVSSLATSPHAATAMEVRFDSTRGVLPRVVWACAQAMGHYPLINASWEADGIRVFEEVHIGVAVDLLYEGLVVPVVRQASRLDPAALADRIADLHARAHARSLGVADLTGGTFTVSSLGRSGTLFTVPVINQPQAAILSCDTVAPRPVVLDDGTVGVAPVGVLTLSFDHRVFDGAYAAAYLSHVRTLLNPHQPPRS